MDIIIKKADKGDAENILKIQRMSFISEAELYNDYNIAPLIQTLDELRNDFDSYVILKAIADNKIVGSVKARLNDNICWIGRLIVLPQYQNQGIGKTLMAAIEDCFPCAEKYELVTGSKSVKNIHLYNKLGYRITGEEKDGNVTMVHMQK